ncbi:hypothetical protein HYS49_01420 [Candidatus Woesearchaeota archaeon]|nr:hypothetical protein [Candidatus Woesearchaeota archaeon]
MPDDQKTASVPIDQAALAQYKKEALGVQVIEETLRQGGSSLTGFFESLDRLSELFLEDKETIARLDKAITSLESEPQRQNKREDRSFADDSLADSLLTASYKRLERMHNILDSSEQHLAEMREILDTAERLSESSPYAVMQPAPATERELDSGNISGEYAAIQESRAPNTAGLETSALDVSTVMHSYYDGQLEEALRDNRVFLIEHPLKRAPRFWTRVKRAALPMIAGVALGGLLGYCALSEDEPEEPSYDTARAHIQHAASLGESRALRQRIEQQTSAFDALPAERENVSPSYSTISMATPEEAIAQYNAFLESVGGELIVSVRPYRAFAEAAGEQATEAGICRAALGELYRAMAFQETDALDEQQFADMLSFRCTDVDVDAEHYRFVPYNGQVPQTGEDR